jgi:hypothetical protein
VLLLLAAIAKLVAPETLGILIWRGGTSTDTGSVAMGGETTPPTERSQACEGQPVGAFGVHGPSMIVASWAPGHGGIVTQRNRSGSLPVQRY